MNQLLINSTEELKEYLSVVDGFTFDVLKPSIRLAQNRYIKKIVGPTLFNKMLNEFQDGEGEGEGEGEESILIPIEKREELLDLVKHSLAFLAFQNYVDVNQLNISDSGIHITSSDHQKTAFRWQIQDLKNHLLDTAYNNIELLMDFLNANIDIFEDWKESDLFLKKSNLICFNSQSFQKGYNINNQRLTFMAYLPKIEYVEDMIVSNMLCNYYDELLNKLHKKQKVDDAYPTLSELELKVVDALQKGIAKLAVSFGVHEFSVEQSVFGVIQKNVEDRSGTESFRPANNQSKEIIASSMKREGQEYLDKAMKIIKSNLDEFSTYKESPCYVEDSKAKSTGGAREMRPQQRDSFFST